MAVIKIDTKKVSSTLGNIKKEKTSFIIARNNFNDDANFIEKEIRRQSAFVGANIGSSISSIKSKLSNIESKMTKVEAVIGFATVKYEEAENKIAKNLKESNINNKKANPFTLKGIGEKVNDLVDGFLGFANSDLVSTLKDVSIEDMENSVKLMEDKNVEILLNPFNTEMPIDKTLIDKLKNKIGAIDDFFTKFEIAEFFKDLFDAGINGLKNGWDVMSKLAIFVVESIPTVLKFGLGAIAGALLGAFLGAPALVAAGIGIVVTSLLDFVIDDLIFNDDTKEYLKNDFYSIKTDFIAFKESYQALVGSAKKGRAESANKDLVLA